MYVSNINDLCLSTRRQMAVVNRDIINRFYKKQINYSIDKSDAINRLCVCFAGIVSCHSEPCVRNLKTR